MINTCFPPSHQVIVGGGLAPTVWQRTSISFPEDTGSFLFKIVTDVGPTVKRKDVLRYNESRVSILIEIKWLHSSNLFQ